MKIIIAAITIINLKNIFLFLNSFIFHVLKINNNEFLSNIFEKFLIIYILNIDMIFIKKNISQMIINYY